MFGSLPPVDDREAKPVVFPFRYTPIVVALDKDRSVCLLLQSPADAPDGLGSIIDQIAQIQVRSASASALSTTLNAAQLP